MRADHQAALKRWWERWRAPTEECVYARLRVGLAVAALYNLWCNLPLADWLGRDSLWPAAQLARAFPGEFWRVDLFLWLPDSMELLPYVLGGVSAVAFALGWGWRVSGLLLWLCLVSLRNRCLVAFGDGGLQVLPGALLFLLCAPASRMKSRRATESWPLRLIQLQICLIYLQSGYYKLLGPQWWQGEALRWSLLNPQFARFGLDSLWTHPGGEAFCWLGGWITLLWELSFPLWLLGRRTRPLSLALGLVMHLSLWLLFVLGVFPLAMLVLYLAFWPARPQGTVDGKSGLPLWARRVLAGHAGLLLWIAWPAVSLVDQKTPPPTPLPQVEAALVATHQALALVPGVSWLDLYAGALGLEHRFHTFSPVVATYAVFYRVVAVSPAGEQLLWDGAPALAWRSYDPQARWMAGCAAGNHPERVFLALTGWQRVLDPNHRLELREWWTPLPQRDKPTEEWTAGRVWQLLLENGQPVLRPPGP